MIGLGVIKVRNFITTFKCRLGVELELGLDLGKFYPLPCLPGSGSGSSQGQGQSQGQVRVRSGSNSEWSVQFKCSWQESGVQGQIKVQGQGQGQVPCVRSRSRSPEFRSQVQFT
jgi:hypothetical protein